MMHGELKEKIVIKGKLVANTKACKSVFQGGELITDDGTYKAYPAKDKNIQKILYQYNGMPETEFFCVKNGKSIEISGVNDDDFSLCLEKTQKAEREMKECEEQAEQEFKEIFGKGENFKAVFNGIVNAHIIINIDLQNRTFSSFDEGKDSFKNCVNQIKNKDDKAALFFNAGALEKYLWNFLCRNFYWQYRARVMPKMNIGEVHMGQNGSKFNAENVKSLYISPRLRAEVLGQEEKWGNYEALNRRVSFKPFSIGHLLETGFVIHNTSLEPSERLVHIEKVEEFYSYFQKELTTSEKIFVQQYLDYVNAQKEKCSEYEELPLLLPQYRYGGLEIKHQYRADFLIIDAYSSIKSAFIEIDDPGHKDMYDMDTEKRNELESAFHFQHFTIRPQDDIEDFFVKRIQPLLSC